MKKSCCEEYYVVKVLRERIMDSCKDVEKRRKKFRRNKS